jgi:multidrug efflux pump
LPSCRRGDRARHLDGFNVQLRDRAGLGHDALIAARNQFLGMAMQDKRLVGVRPNGQDDVASTSSTSTTPRRARSASRWRTSTTRSPQPGGHHVNDFIDRGRIRRWRRPTPTRMKPEDL